MKLGRGKIWENWKPSPNWYKILLKGQSLCAERISKMPTNPEIPAQTLSCSLIIPPALASWFCLSTSPSLAWEEHGLGCIDNQVYKCVIINEHLYIVIKEQPALPQDPSMLWEHCLVGPLVEMLELVVLVHGLLRWECWLIGPWWTPSACKPIQEWSAKAVESVDGIL